MIAGRWGVRDDEISRSYPCDEFVPHPTIAAWRGVTVYAAADELWRWVGQIRLAPYSYDWIDNLGHRSPPKLVGLPDPVVGETFSTGFGRPCGRVLAVTPGEALTGRIVGATMSYLLVPEQDGVRLLLKVVTMTARVPAPIFRLVDLVMVRRQLLTFKHLAESA